jgi:hypothetical protein
MPDAGPGVPMRDAAYGVTTEAEARRDVQDLAAHKPDFIKIWVDDRNGTVEKLKPNLYRAIIDEAHAHHIRVMAHIASLDDAKDLLRAGIDGFGHAVRDRDIDDELLAMLRQRRDVFFVVTLWGERNAIYDEKPAWLSEPILRDTLSSGEIAQLADGFSRATPPQRESARRLLKNVATLSAAGVPLGLGTDTGGVTGGGYFGLASQIELELRRHAHLGVDSGTRHARLRRSGEVRRLPRARRQPARRHSSDQADCGGLPARRRTEPLRLEGEVAIIGGQLVGHTGSPVSRCFGDATCRERAILSRNTQFGSPCGVRHQGCSRDGVRE